MKGKERISTLMLERYHLGEISAEERMLVEGELSLDPELNFRYKSLDESDRELRSLFPWKQNTPKTRRSPGKKRFYLLYAAAVFLCLFVPAVYYLRGTMPGVKPGVKPGVTPGGKIEVSGLFGDASDRIKGTGIKTELSIYLKENTPASFANTDEGLKLSDRALLREGNTVQLAYTIPPGDVQYGMIFSIDGRAAVTMHYPYGRGQSSILTAGKKTFLSEAYTLDDAPDFEIFFMVVSKKPLDTEIVLGAAANLAREMTQGIPVDPRAILEKNGAVFQDCEIEVISIQKE